jgi:hypothetical protein
MSTIVVPAHAGTHNYRRLLFEDWHFELAKHDVRWLSVPAPRFALPTLVPWRGTIMHCRDAMCVRVARSKPSKGRGRRECRVLSRTHSLASDGKKDTS